MYCFGAVCLVAHGWQFVLTNSATKLYAWRILCDRTLCESREHNVNRISTLYCTIICCVPVTLMLQLFREPVSSRRHVCHVIHIYCGIISLIPAPRHSTTGGFIFHERHCHQCRGQECVNHMSRWNERELSDPHE